MSNVSQDIGLALRALSKLHASLGRSRTLPGLVIAGGYDARLPENVEYYEELYGLAEELGLLDKVCVGRVRDLVHCLVLQVVFLRSVPDNHKTLLLSACTAVLYTPQHEHFGIVPLEAMAWGKAVVACDSGGPKESVVSGRTGLLCEPTAAAFADAMRQLMVRVRVRVHKHTGFDRTRGWRQRWGVRRGNTCC